MPSLKQRCSSLCTLDCKGLRVQQEHFHTQYPRAVSVQRLEHPLGEKEGLRGRGGGARGEKEVQKEGGGKRGLKILAQRKRSAVEGGRGRRCAGGRGVKVVGSQKSRSGRTEKWRGGK